LKGTTPQRPELSEGSRKEKTGLIVKKNIIIVQIVLSLLAVAGGGYLFLMAGRSGDFSRPAVLLVIAGPLMVAVLGWVSLRRFLKPARLEGLNDEFAGFSPAFDNDTGQPQKHPKAIEESLRQYGALFESAADAMFILDGEKGRQGKILKANGAASRMYGYTVEELLKMNISDLDTPGPAAIVRERIDRLVAGETLRVEADRRRKNGTVFAVDISAAAFETSGRKYILAIDRDSDEKRRSAEAIQRERQNAFVAELASGLAHEIKNPLAGIKATIDVLSEESGMPAEDRSALKNVVPKIKRIESLLKILLNFARPPKPQFSRTQVNAVLDNAVDLALRDRSHASDAETAVRVIREYDDTLPEIDADPMQLQQIFTNLLLNASEAMPKGGTVFLKTLLDATTRTLEVRISDTGPGIDEEARKHIFQPFYSKKAAGPGLAIASRLVEEHGGSIGVQCPENRGSLFMVRLPVNQAQRRQI